RHQPGGFAPRREESGQRAARPRDTGRAPYPRRAPGRGRADHGARRALRALCQPRQDQCDPAEGHGPGDDHARAGGRPDRRQGGKRSGQAEAAERRHGQGNQEQAGQGRRRGRSGLTVAKKAKAEKSKPRALPSRDEILAFIAEHPGKAGKREIARAFGIAGGDKIALKAPVKELAEDGLVERWRKRRKRPTDLPPVAVLVVTGRDSDGELIAEPLEWPEESDPSPKILIPRDKRRDAPVP